MDLSTESGSYPDPESPSMQNKRANKPLVERKRRGRINKSIDELKQIVLLALNKDDKDYCKMEKADILEMVVRHLKAIRRNQLTVESLGEPAPVWHNYRAGFNECASEVMQYMRGAQGVNPGVQVRMINHLAECIQRVNTFPQVDPMTSPPHVAHPMTSPVHHMTSSPHVTAATTTRVTSPIVPPMARTPETSQSTAPPMLVKCEQPERGYYTSGGVPIVDHKAHRGSPRIDQIVPGSHSPDLDLENSSMVDVYDLHLRRTSPPSIWSQYNHSKVTDRCHSPSLKVKGHGMRPASSPQPPMRNGDRKSIGPIRDAYSRSVWRPW